MTDTHHSIIKADQRGRLHFAPDQRAILQRRDRSAGTGNDGPKHRMIFVAGPVRVGDLYGGQPGEFVGEGCPSVLWSRRLGGRKSPSP